MYFKTDKVKYAFNMCVSVVSVRRYIIKYSSNLFVNTLIIKNKERSEIFDRQFDVEISDAWIFIYLTLIFNI